MVSITSLAVVSTFLMVLQSSVGLQEDGSVLLKQHHRHSAPAASLTQREGSELWGEEELVDDRLIVYRFEVTGVFQLRDKLPVSNQTVQLYREIDAQVEMVDMRTNANGVFNFTFSLGFAANTTFSLNLTTYLNCNDILFSTSEIRLNRTTPLLNSSSAQKSVSVDWGVVTLDPKVVKTYTVSGRFVDGDKKPLAHVNYTLQILIEGFVFKIKSGDAADDGTFVIKTDTIQFVYCFLQLEASKLGFFEFTTLDNETGAPGPVLVGSHLTKDLGDVVMRIKWTNFTILSRVLDAEGRQADGLEVKMRISSDDEQVSQELEGGRTDADGLWLSAPVQVEYRPRFVVETILKNANWTRVSYLETI